MNSLVHCFAFFVIVHTHWLKLRRSEIWKQRLFLSNRLNIRGSAEDFNKYPAKDAGKVFLGRLDENGAPAMDPVKIAEATNTVIDRLPLVALWDVGLRYVIPEYHLKFSADVHNMLNGQFYEQEAYMDPAAYLETGPNPLRRISFFLSGQINL